MTNHGDDCYFFYYSTCTKGDSCPFRHCEAAMGNETVCNLWKEGRCFRTVCKFRHMEITKKRKEIACYWENHPAGCQKPHCAFFHERPRYIDGTFFPPDKSQHRAEEVPNEEPAPPTAPPLQAAANPQLRGVKTENQEPVPSPTHPPVVINPADDDEDEDDQFSEEGEDGKVGPSPRKLPRSESLNVGVSTLEEIRLRRSLKASMRRADGPDQMMETTANGGKENIRAFYRASRHTEAPLEDVGRSTVTGRLGRKIPSYPNSGGEGVPMKRSLAERLGRIVDTDELTGPPQKALKTVKERLRLTAEAAAVSPAAESSAASKKTPELIRIKTLEEIRQEKAAKSQRDNSIPDVSEVNLTRTVPAKAAKGVKRSISVKDQQIGHVKTFSEILHAKKRRQEEEEQQEQDKAVTKPQEDLGKDGPDPQTARAGEVRVKTLEEIRREKAARSRVQDTPSRSSDPEKAASKKPRVITTPPAPSDVTAEKAAPVQPKPHQPPKDETRASSGGSVQVKSFEEIMREKRLRKQETAAQESGSSRDAAQAPASTAVDTTLKRQVRKLLPLRSKAAASPANGSAAPHSTPSAVTTVTAEGPGTPSKGPGTPSKGPSKTSRGSNKTACSSTVSSAVKQTRAAQAAPCPPADAPQPTEKKVRPKLNVKPSVVKPAAPVKPRQKRKGTERSAVAAVKPLNSSAPAALDKQVLPSSSAEAQLNAAVPRSPTNLLETSSSGSPLREEQTVPVFKQSPRTETRLNVSAPAPRETDVVPQSPVLKTQSKTRRQSVASPRISDTFSTDDFEELINEFTDDHLDEDVDPGIAEDDLLQELTDMIDS